MLEKMKNFVVEEEGQGLTEYGLLVGLLVLVIIAIMATFETGLTDVFNTLITKIKTAVTGS